MVQVYIFIISLFVFVVLLILYILIISILEFSTSLASIIAPYSNTDQIKTEHIATNNSSEINTGYAVIVTTIIAVIVCIFLCFVTGEVSSFLYFAFLILCIGLTIGFTIYALDDQKKSEQRIRALKISDVDNMDGYNFEHYVCILLNHKGYCAYVTKASGDHGADIIAEKDGISWAVQTKRHFGKVSNSAVQEVVASMKMYGCQKSMVVTNNYFTRGAIDLAESNGTVLIDRSILSDWIIEYHGNISNDKDSEDIQENIYQEIEQEYNQEQEDKCKEETLYLNKYQLSTDDHLLQENIDMQDSNMNISDNVMATIKKKATNDYPDDYSMQLYIIKEQLEAYKQILEYGTSNIDKEVLYRIRQKAINDYPDDYSMQIYVIKEQVESFMEITKYYNETPSATEYNNTNKNIPHSNTGDTETHSPTISSVTGDVTGRNGRTVESIACPNCGKSLKIPQQYLNVTGKCKFCNGKFIPQEHIRCYD